MYISIDLAILLGIYSMDIITKVYFNVHKRILTIQPFKTLLTFKKSTYTILLCVPHMYLYICTYECNYTKNDVEENWLQFFTSGKKRGIKGRLIPCIIWLFYKKVPG